MFIWLFFRVFTEVHAEEEVPEEDEFVPLCPIIDKVDELRYRLPPHQRCVAHTLNLVATVDGARAEQTNQDYAKVARGVFSKCQKLWNKQGQSAVAADAVKAHCGIYLPRPAITRWNSFFKSMEAIERQLKKGDDLDELFSKLAVPRLQRPTEPRFIEEFCRVSTKTPKLFIKTYTGTNVLVLLNKHTEPILNRI